jgi:hypothetical protein
MADQGGRLPAERIAEPVGVLRRDLEQRQNVAPGFRVAPGDHAREVHDHEIGGGAIRLRFRFYLVNGHVSSGRSIERRKLFINGAAPAALTDVNRPVRRNCG